VDQVYQIASKKDSRQLAEFLAQNGQALLPMVDLIEQVQRWDRSATHTQTNRVLGE